MPWATSTRRARLPRDWPKRVAKVKRRARGRCEAYWTPGRLERTGQHHPDCDGRGTDCDHIQQGDDHELSNLQLLSYACHKAKTLADRPTRTRPVSRHPGLV